MKQARLPANPPDFRDALTKSVLPKRLVYFHFHRQDALMERSQLFVQADGGSGARRMAPRLDPEKLMLVGLFFCLFTSRKRFRSLRGWQ
jgi:hypothetical protein